MIVPIAWAGMPRSFWKAGAKEPTSEKIRLEMNEIDPTIETRRNSGGIMVAIAVRARRSIRPPAIAAPLEGEVGAKRGVGVDAAAFAVLRRRRDHTPHPPAKA